MLKKGIPKFFMVALLVAGFVAFENWKHKFDRPWAYSDGPLLLGKWEGQFRDPDGIQKKIWLEIIEPEPETSESGYNGEKYDISRKFKGFAKIESKLGIENQRISGDLASKDGHQIDQITFSPVDEKKHVLESFNVGYADKGGVWDGDVIRLNLIFTYRTKTGSAFSDSGDPRFDVTALLTLHRVKN